MVGFGQFSDIKEATEASLLDSFAELSLPTAPPTGPMRAHKAGGVFTAGLDVVQNVVVGVQVSVEDKPHGELCKNKTQLRRKRERVGTHDHVFLQVFGLTQRTEPG